MTIKKVSNKRLIADDRWKMKGGPMKTGKELEPKVCPDCDGFGFILEGNAKITCTTCDGLGELL